MTNIHASQKLYVLHALHGLMQKMLFNVVCLVVGLMNAIVKCDDLNTTYNLDLLLSKSPSCTFLPLYRICREHVHFPTNVN